MAIKSWATLEANRRMMERDKQARVIRDRERIQDMANKQMAAASNWNKKANLIGGLLGAGLVLATGGLAAPALAFGAGAGIGSYGAQKLFGAGHDDKGKWADLDTSTAEGRRMDADTYRAVDRLIENEKMDRALNAAQIAMTAGILGQGLAKSPTVGKEAAQKVGGIKDSFLKGSYVPKKGSSAIQDIVGKIHGDLTSRGHKIADLGSVTAKKGPGLLGRIGKGVTKGISKLPSPKELLEFNKARRAGFLGNFDIWKSIQGATFTEMP